MPSEKLSGDEREATDGWHVVRIGQVEQDSPGQANQENVDLGFVRLWDVLFGGEMLPFLHWI